LEQEKPLSGAPHGATESKLKNSEGEIVARIVEIMVKDIIAEARPWPDPFTAWVRRAIGPNPVIEGLRQQCGGFQNLLRQMVIKEQEK
jgi:hypothetical protein